MSLVGIVALPMAYLLLPHHDSESYSGSSGRLDLGVLRDPAVRYLVLGYALHVIQEHVIKMWLPGFFLVVLVAKGADSTDAAARAAAIAGLALAGGALGPVIGGSISDRLGRTTSASAIFALSGVCGWLIGWTIGLPLGLIVGLSVVYSWAVAADSPIYSTGVTEVASPVALGSTMAVQAFIGFMGGVVGPIIFGGILDLFSEAHQWKAAFSAVGLLSLVVIVGMQRLRSLPQSRLLARGKG